MLEVLQDFPSARPPLAWVLQTVPRLQPRLFSISSSPAAHPATAHITAAIVDWATPFKRRRKVPATALPGSLSPAGALHEEPTLMLSRIHVKNGSIQRSCRGTVCISLPAGGDVPVMQGRRMHGPAERL